MSADDNTNEFFLIPTALGRAMIADSIATGEDINLTMVAVGDADYVPTGGQTALLNERARVEIMDIVRDEANPAHLKICAILPPDVGGWRIHEVGILVENGNLFAIGKMDGSYKPLYNTGMTKEVLLDLRLEVGAEPNINLVIDPHVIIATREWVTEYLAPWKELWQAHTRDRENPHKVAIPQIPGLTERLDGVDGALNAKLNKADYSGFPDGDAYVDIPWAGQVSPTNSKVRIQNFIAPADGFVNASRATTVSSAYPGVFLHLESGNLSVSFNPVNAPNGYLGFSLSLPVAKGAVVTVQWDIDMRMPGRLTFVPAKRAPGL